MKPALQHVRSLISITVAAKAHKTQWKLSLHLIAFLIYDLQFKNSRVEMESTVTPVHITQPCHFKKYT